MAVTHPSASANRYTCHSCACPLSTRTPSPAASTPWPTCVAISSLRRSTRSASSPAYGDSRSTGANCRAVVMPTATPDSSVSSVRTSQSWATRCIQVPTFATSAPANHSR